LVPLALAYVALIAASVRIRMDDLPRKIVFACIAVVVLTFCLMFVLAYVVHWPFWGRHLAAVFPFLLMIMAISLDWLCNRSILGRLLVVVFFLLFATSSLELRFNPVHGKDDYREAVAIARRALARNQLIWWAADSETASYYGLPSDSSNLVMFWPPSQRSLAALPEPKFVFLSKRDIYDPNGSITDYLRKHSFELEQILPAFKIWEQPSPHPQIN
ncbi:MAG TPA: hypothetical protein VE843_06135, partial [Ktedonobacteraceae bacterium]|nr:hypothetical protein [Ktedonobacteraceae bacterium]